MNDDELTAFMRSLNPHPDPVPPALECGCCSECGCVLDHEYLEREAAEQAAGTWSPR